MEVFVSENEAGYEYGAAQILPERTAMEQ